MQIACALVPLPLVGHARAPCVSSRVRALVGPPFRVFFAKVHFTFNAVTFNDKLQWHHDLSCPGLYHEGTRNHVACRCQGMLACVLRAVAASSSTRMVRCIRSPQLPAVGSWHGVAQSTPTVKQVKHPPTSKSHRPGPSRPALPTHVQVMVTAIIMPALQCPSTGQASQYCKHRGGLRISGQRFQATSGLGAGGCCGAVR